MCKFTHEANPGIKLYPHHSLLISPCWSKKMHKKSEERLNTPFIVIHAIFCSLIIKLTRKHSRLKINAYKNVNKHARGRGQSFAGPPRW
jgi:hypothetical protein